MEQDTAVAPTLGVRLAPLQLSCSPEPSLSLLGIPPPSLPQTELCCQGAGNQVQPWLQKPACGQLSGAYCEASHSEAERPCTHMSSWEGPAGQLQASRLAPALQRLSLQECPWQGL